MEELRRRYGWGRKKLAAEGIELSVATVNRILRRRGRCGRCQTWGRIKPISRVARGGFRDD